MRILLLPLLVLAGCGEAVEDNHFADDVQEARPVSDPVTSAAVPVRIGELGPSFPACNTTGMTRNLDAGQSLDVRAAPFDTAETTARVASGTRFFVCARSLDQKWLGIVFDTAGAGSSCGVTAPVPSRRNYEGPCGSGWVSSPFVKLVAGTNEPQQPQQQGLFPNHHPQILTHLSTSDLVEIARFSPKFRVFHQRISSCQRFTVERPNFI